jgi:hypothetical protein
VAKQKQTQHVISRRAAPFAPLALSVLAGTGIHSDTAVLHGSSAPTEVSDLKPERCESVTDIMDCHERYASGCSIAGGRYDPYLNFMKNKLIAPLAGSSAPARWLGQSDFEDLDTNTPTTLGGAGESLLDEEDQLTSLGEGTVVGVIGYLYYAKSTGPETSNCQIGKDDQEPAKDEANFDYHIGIGFDADLAHKVLAGTKLSKDERKSVTQQSIIVEMTPHYRINFKETGWTSGSLKAVVGRQVKVVGQLMADSEHNKPNQNCAIAENDKQRTSCWRASVWELHPVTNFLVCRSTTTDCTRDSSDWIDLSDAALQETASR